MHLLACTGFKGIVNFEINSWDVLAYFKGIQDVGRVAAGH